MESSRTQFMAEGVWFLGVVDVIQLDAEEGGQRAGVGPAVVDDLADAVILEDLLGELNDGVSPGLVLHVEQEAPRFCRELDE